MLCYRYVTIYHVRIFGGDQFKCTCRSINARSATDSAIMVAVRAPVVYALLAFTLSSVYFVVNFTSRFNPNAIACLKSTPSTVNNTPAVDSASKQAVRQLAYLPATCFIEFTVQTYI